uniref:Variant surface glycoprotein 1125.276 n=1 Tax=Trypanosoma brucei TaxID=5691 RepID=A0A1J0R493_9TRYP|nr:variant surface glycoprotein 1125.276 [Trypanosoma brucei]
MQGKPTITTSKLLALVVLAAGCTLSHNASAAPADEGTNSQVFALLCELVRAAATTTPKQPAAQINAQTKKTATLIKLLIADSTVISQLAHTDDADSIIAKAGSKATEMCGGTNREDCINAANHLREIKNKQEATLIAKLSEPSLIRQRLAETATKLTKLIEDSEKNMTCTNGFSYENIMNKALIGKQQGGNNFRLHMPGTNRQTACGQGPNTAGATAGMSIADDLLCLCASETGHENNKGCDSDSGEAVDFSQPHDSQGTEWERLHSLCIKRTPHNIAKTGSDLRNLLGKVKQAIAAPQANDKKNGYLGTLKDGGTAGNCDGTNTAGRGACAFYGKTTDAAAGPAWLKTVEEAADCLDHLKQQQQSALLRQQEIQLLNNSLTDLLHLHSNAAGSKPGAKEEPSLRSDGIQISDATRRCAAAEDSKDECDKLAKHGCVYNQQGDSGKKCTLKPEAQAQLEKSSQETESKTGSTNTTQSSNSFVIKTSPLLLAVLLF